MLLRSQIDSIVPLEYIGLALNDSPGLCKALLEDKAKADQFRQLIHSGKNIVPVAFGVQDAKRYYINNLNTQNIQLQYSVRQLLPD